MTAELRLAILRRIAAGESPYTGIPVRSPQVIEVLLEEMRAEGLWTWDDEGFHVLRILTDAGNAVLEAAK